MYTVNLAVDSIIWYHITLYYINTGISISAIGRINPNYRWDGFCLGIPCVLTSIYIYNRDILLHTDDMARSLLQHLVCLNFSPKLAVRKFPIWRKPICTYAVNCKSISTELRDFRQAAGFGEQNHTSIRIRRLHFQDVSTTYYFKYFLVPLPPLHGTSTVVQ